MTGLPERTVPMNNDGMQKLIESIKKKPELASRIADEVERNPREAVAKYFRLSTVQQAAIQNTSDSELKDKAAELVSALRKGVFEKLVFIEGEEEGEGEERRRKCRCKIIIVIESEN